LSVKKLASRQSPCLGAHLSITGGLHRALLAALRLGCTTVQVFVKNQRQWVAPALRPADVARWHEVRAENAFGPLVAHASYLVNLATPHRKLRQRSVSAFVEELTRCDQLAVSYLVVHPGAATDGSITRGLARVAAALNEVFRRYPDCRTMPLLETTAGQGRSLGRSFAELAEILSRLEQPQRVGVCVDTCHVFAAGYDLRTRRGYDALVGEATRLVGQERIRVWHLNDCLGTCGSRLDRHAHIGAGTLGRVAFARLLHDARFRGLPMILETPKGTDERGRDWDAVNLARLRRLADRRSDDDNDLAGG